MSLKWTGLLDATSVLSVQVGTRTSLMVATAAVVVYLGYNEAMMAHLRRVGSASRTVLHAVLVGDLVLILMVLVSVTPPSEYARGLILTVFVVQFTRLYFGLRATVVSIMAAAVGYTGLIVASTHIFCATSAVPRFIATTTSFPSYIREKANRPAPFGSDQRTHCSPRRKAVGIGGAGSGGEAGIFRPCYPSATPSRRQVGCNAIRRRHPPRQAQGAPSTSDAPTRLGTALSPVPVDAGG